LNIGSSTHRRYFPRGPGLGLRTLALLLCALALIFADSNGNGLTGLRNGASLALAPVIWLASLPRSAGNATDQLRSRETLLAENRELHEKQLILEARLQKLVALEAENERIRELLSSAKSLNEHVLIAEIIGINQDPYRHQITLNKGTRDGIYRGQALVDASGILGQVTEVGATTSKALLITDPDHGIPVEINRTGLQTIAIGRGDGRGLKLPFLPSNADIQVGDLLVSSPLGGRFPAGYPVGEVYEIRHTPGEHFMEALAYPSARLNQGRQALLVWSESFAVPEIPREPLVP
jgi:rod shape-determining protein MreC